MASKVYWIALEATLQTTRRYIQRNQINLEKNLTAPQMACVNATLSAILSCLALLPSNTPIV